MACQRRNLKIKNSEPAVGPPSKRRTLEDMNVTIAVIFQLRVWSLKIKNSDPAGGLPAKRCRLQEDISVSDCCGFLVQVPPVPECNLQFVNKPWLVLKMY
jgi:hypothetical protein